VRGADTNHPDPRLGRNLARHHLSPVRKPRVWTKAISSIEARLNKIMDEYLLPDGYEFQKVQHDFQRLMQGKELFDRGMIEAQDACTDNNERHEILRSLHEYVLPNYDDIAANYPEL
jgi:hypothetical protein